MMRSRNATFHDHANIPHDSLRTQTTVRDKAIVISSSEHGQQTQHMSLNVWLIETDWWLHELEEWSVAHDSPQHSKLVREHPTLNPTRTRLVALPFVHLDCFKTLILQETLKTQKQHQVDSCAFSEVTRSCH